MPHTKGMLAIEALLRAPRRQFHALELATVVDHTGGDASTQRDAGDDILDPRAMAEYRQRVADLQADIDEADRFRDEGRAAAARAEMDTIIEELEAGPPGSAGDRARRRRTPSERECGSRSSSATP